MRIFESAVHAMIKEDIDQGHIGEDAPVWGRYEGLLRTALLEINRHHINASFNPTISSIIKWEL